jgi:predicted TIM-barrel fold metal-dependent hydrolase
MNMATEARARSPRPDGSDALTIVDHQAHWYPRSCVEALARRSTFPRVERTADGGYVLLVDENEAQPRMDVLTKDIDEHLAQADEAGIDMLVLGPATLAEVLHLPAAEAAELLEPIHQEYAAAQRAHPDRIACIAALPMQDPSVALDVLNHAVGDLGLCGVSLLAPNEGRPLVTEELLPVYARVGELGVPLFLHPALRTNTRPQTKTRRAEWCLAWTFHTALAALQLIDGGVLDEVPELAVVHPHLGGVLPYVAGRISAHAGVEAGSYAAEPLEYYLTTNFYADTAQATPAALHLAIEMYGIDRIVFATDHPFHPMDTLRHYVDDNVSPETAAQIYANRVPGLPVPASRSSS